MNTELDAIAYAAKKRTLKQREFFLTREAIVIRSGSDSFPRAAFAFAYAEDSRHRKVWYALTIARYCDCGLTLEAGICARSHFRLETQGWSFGASKKHRPSWVEQWMRDHPDLLASGSATAGIKIKAAMKSYSKRRVGEVLKLPLSGQLMEFTNRKIFGRHRCFHVGFDYKKVSKYLRDASVDSHEALGPRKRGTAALIADSTGRGMRALLWYSEGSSEWTMMLIEGMYEEAEVGNKLNLLKDLLEEEFGVSIEVAVYKCGASAERLVEIIKGDGFLVQKPLTDVPRLRQTSDIAIVRPSDEEELGVLKFFDDDSRQFLSEWTLAIHDQPSVKALKKLAGRFRAEFGVRVKLVHVKNPPSHFTAVRYHLQGSDSDWND